MNNVRGLMRFAFSATNETLRNSPQASRHVEEFFSLSKRVGMTAARTWLLGRLVMDESPEADPAFVAPNTHPHLDPAHRRRTDHSNRGRPTRKQNVKAQLNAPEASIYLPTSRLG
jgi:hypothetical protein